MCHVNILWAEEDLPIAAAIQLLNGKTLYRDVWFDKPPLVPGIYLLWGAQNGVLLRVACALFAFSGCWLAYRLGLLIWGQREGLLAAAFLGFFLVFGIHAAVIPLAADLLMLVPHLGAVYLAWKGRPFLSGIVAGIALLFNSKAMFVLAVCAVWQFRSLPALLLGFAVPNLATLGWMALRGSAGDYWTQVWHFGSIYARNTFLEHPASHGLLRTANWIGFHSALVLSAVWCFLRDTKAPRWRIAAWLVLSGIAVLAGWRFFPRYYLQLLPVFALACARGFTLMRGRARLAVVLLLFVPFIRFGPRYVALAADLAAGRQHEWRDVAMDLDSQAAARQVLAQARPGDTLFIWGFRPDIYVYTRMPAAARFLESQPLSGVFADRHLTQSESVAPELASRFRKELVQSRPTFVLDGLGPYNPALSIQAYEDLQPWLRNYQLVGRTRTVLIYRAGPTGPSKPASVFPETQ